MSATASDLQFRFSGGASNGDPALSLGGVISNTTIVTPSDFWDWIDYNESHFGDTEYRCIYLRNTHTSDTFFGVKAYVIEALLPGGAPTPDILNIQWDPAGIGNGTSTGVAVTIVSDHAVPSGVSFPSTPPVSDQTALAAVNLPSQWSIALWMKRAIPSGSDLPHFSQPIVKIIFGD